MRCFAFVAVLLAVGSLVWAELPPFALHADPTQISTPKPYPFHSFGPWVAINKPTTTPDRLTHATVYCNGKIYMIGGTPNGQPGSNVTTCSEYDPVANTWTDKAPMTTARGWIKGSAVKGKIYVIGGYSNSQSVLNTNEEFDPVANSWRSRAARPRAACAALEAVWRDTLIYVMGGYTGTGVTNVDIYNPATNTWSTGTALPQAADMGDAAIIGDTIYIAQAYNRPGGSAWPNLYKGAINPSNPTQITWSQGPAMTPPVAIGGSCAAGGNIYWLGGFENVQTVTANCKRYNRTTGLIENYDTYIQPQARCCYLTAIESRQEIYCIAGDLNGDWNPPNNEYNKSSIVKVEEYWTFKQKSNFGIETSRPNPIKNNCRIAFVIPRGGKVDLKLYNLQGQALKTLVNTELSAGRHEISLDTRDLASGVYFVKLTLGNYTTENKLTVLK